MNTVIIIIENSSDTDTRTLLETIEGDTYTSIQTLREVLMDEFKVESKYLSIMTMAEFTEEWNDSDDCFEGFGNGVVSETFIGYAQVQI